MGLSQPLFSQESDIKSYFDEQNNRKLCFYNSTLRMINLTRNESFDEMIRGVKKVLIYELDSTSIAENEAKAMIDVYKQRDYDEYVSMIGGKMEMMIYGNEKIEAMVGFFQESEKAFAIYLDGKIELQKIPTLINTIKDNEILNFMDINNNYD